MKHSIDVGYRHIDCAHIYLNELEVGAGINEKIAEGVIERDEMFVVSKLWNTYHRPDLVCEACKTSLNNLNLNYLDLYLMHWPFAYAEGDVLIPRDAYNRVIFSDVDFMDTWKEMEKLVITGLVKSIGVSNFNKRQLHRLLTNCEIKPVVNQIECHPYLTQIPLSAYCMENNVIVTAYSPLGSPHSPWMKPGDPVILEEPKILEIAKKYNKDAAQILIRYQIQRGHIVIPKSVTKSRIISNINVFNFTLDAEDIREIEHFERNGRLWPMTGLVFKQL